MTMAKKIKDKTIVLNTGDNGEVDVDTEKINGQLLAVFIKTEQKVEDTLKKYNLKISFSDFPSITILDELSIDRSEMFIPIKTDYWNVNTTKYADADFFFLNDKLNIALSNAKNLQATITIRYKVI